MRIGHRVPPAVAIALVLTVGLPTVTSADVFFCGSGDVGVACLIDSIESANAGRGPDTIILEAGTYTFTVANNTIDAFPFGLSLGNALPSITGRVTIQGAGPTETILDGSHLLRLFHIAASGRLTLLGLTIQNGRISFAPGGAIFNRGTLTVLQTVIRDSGTESADGGGINSIGTLRIVDSRVTSNFAFNGRAGGIQSSGSLHVRRSTIDNNLGLDGCGGIVASGTVTIKDSAIADNAAGGSGGGLHVFGTDSSVTITNTTIANNESGGGPHTAGGGIWVQSGTVLLTNVAVADNRARAGGGVLGTVVLQNTILARNTEFPDPFPSGPDCSGSIVSLGNNIIGDTAGCTIDLASTDFVGDPRLGVFVDNDEIPGHEYIPLLAESPAIDAGNRAACPRRDQHRNRRVDGDSNGRVRCDIGALEFIPTP